MPTGIILKGVGGFYYVKDQKETFECKARGIFRKTDTKPLPGDRVVFSIIDDEKKIGIIDKIEPRSSCLDRPAVANVNQIFIVTSIKSPVPDLLFVDKLTITSQFKGLKAIIVINKIDLDSERSYVELEECYKNAGFPMAVISSKLRNGTESLEKYLKNNITVLAGQSGVGKSTILNNIKNELIMETGNISEKIDRGRHTTRHAELFELKNGGFLLDTPGFSSYELSDILYTDLEKYYPEFQNLNENCRFVGCSHISEPDCVIKKALDENKIDRGRYERYIEIYNVLKQQKRY